MNQSLFSPLKARPYRLLLGAQVLSDFGNWLDLIGLQFLIVYRWQLGPYAIASLIITFALPWALVGPFISVFADKWPRKQLMVLCDLIRLITVIGFIFAPNLYILLILVFIKGTAGSLFDPARQGTIRETVDEDLLPQAVTLSQLSVNLTKVVGPAIGALMISLDYRSPFVLEAVGFLLSAMLLSRLPQSRGIFKSISTSITSDISSVSNSIDNSVSTTAITFWQDFKEGILHILKNPILKISITGTSLSMFLIFLYDGLIIFLAKLLGFDENSFGLLVSFVGLGSVLGAGIMGQWTKWKTHPILMMSLMMVFSGIVVSAMGMGAIGFLSFQSWVWLIVAFGLGTIGAASTIPYGYILQSQTPEHLMGRVSAAAQGSQTIAMLSAPAAGAALANVIGVGAVMLLAGGGALILGTAILLYALNLNPPKEAFNQQAS